MRRILYVREWFEKHKAKAATPPASPASTVKSGG
jgi:hypothetical protein